MKFKIGDKVRVIIGNERDVGKVGTIASITDRHELGDREDGFILDIQDQLDAPYYYESELKLVDNPKLYMRFPDGKTEELNIAEDISIRSTKQDLIDQIQYADNQLEKQAIEITKLQNFIRQQTEIILELINKEEI